MKLAFYCNYLNHHQVLVADELFKILGEDFCFVATSPRNEKELKGGVDYSLRSYCLLAGESKSNRLEAFRLAREADVCVFGACSQEYAVERAKNKPQGLSFEMGERWLKRGWINVLSPVLLNWWKNYKLYFRKANFYKLCSSAYAASDDVKLHAYKNRHFKWGYFSETPSLIDSEPANEIMQIMWCARFIDWKHPELALECAKRLKLSGYKFHLDMYGDGKLKPKCEAWVKTNDLEDVISFKGNVPNKTVKEAMRSSDIFLFTSDHQEGWGVVANEAMSSGCVLVASSKIGSVPYLVEDGVNGFIFDDGDITSLTEKVKLLFDDTNLKKNIKRNIERTMCCVWSPENAARNLLLLVDDIKMGRELSVKDGPCSIA